MFLLDNPHLILFMLEFALILGASKLLGLVFKRFKQPTITADLLIGLILGPTILRRFSPAVSQLLFPVDHTQFLMLETIAWTGIFFMLLETGLEVNFASIWRQKKQAGIIAVSGIAIPLLICFLAVSLLPDKYLLPNTNKTLFAMFVAVTMTISAMPIAIRALYDLDILKSDMGFLIVSALTINDFIGWILFTIVLGVYTHGSADLLYILKFVFLTVAFVGGSFFFLRKHVNTIIQRIKGQYEDGIGLTISFITILGMVFGAITLAIGLHALLGFFLAGLIVGGSEFLSEKERHVINKMVYSIFVPFFFVIIGLKMDFLADFDFGLLLLMTLVSVLSKFFGAWIGTIISKNPAKDRFPIAVAHTAGGEMQIVLGMLALETKLISQSIFIAIVGGAIISTILLGPWLSYVLKLRQKSIFHSLFKKEFIFTCDQCGSQEDMIHFLADKASKLVRIPVQEIAENILQRENSMSTALGHHLAIPHARIDHLKKPLILFANSPQPIEWNSPDGLPVHMVFLVLTPAEQSTVQLLILRDIANLFKNPKFSEKLIHIHQTPLIWQCFKEAFN